MNVLIYSRVSSFDQSINGISLEAQEAKLRAYAELYNLSVVGAITDAGESAKSLDRPGLRRALEILRSGRADGLVVTKLDRLTRSVSDWQYLISNIFSDKAGRQLFSVADNIDTRTPSGRLVLNILLSLSQWEREEIGQRTREALRHKIKKGERCGKIPFGYDLADDGRTLVPNSRELGAIEFIVGLRENGYSLRGIATELTSRGIPTKEGGKKWTHSAVSGILQRRQDIA